ncbi:MAG TPA: carboxypeptidase regulatory-like domain-containing protein [Alloacidobacterium sp.]|nr:carboxypeptidase regulatory-like domain-containing protein [Alloacidobacterium sp.]
MTRALFRCVVLMALLPCACAAQTYSITGRALDAATGSPLPRATVSLERVKDHSLFASVSTDENGSFQFLQLPADRYILRGSHRGYITTSFEEHENFTTALVTGEKQNCCTNLQLRLVPGGVISGTVNEDTGEPVENGTVVLYRESNQMGTEHVQRARTTMVDESGAYEFAGLEPGNYFLSASGQPWYATRFMLPRHTGDANDIASSTDMVYATEFYPDTTDEKAAAPIPIRGGDHLTVNFSLHPVPAVHLSVEVPQQTGDRRGPFFVPQVSQQIFGLTEPVLSSFAMTGRIGNSGSVDMRVPPGQYQMRTSEHDDVPGKTVSVDASADQAVDLTGGSTLPDVSGKLSLSSGTALPDNVFVSLTTLAGQNGQGTRLQKDGSFTLHGVSPGVYRLNIFSGNKRFHVGRMVANGAQIGHRQITIGSSPVLLAADLYEDLELSVSGYAKSGDAPARGAMIVLVPADPVHDRDYFRRAQSDSDGSFVFEDVQPGQYTAVAIQDGWSLDWAQPEVINRYLQQGERISVTQHSPRTIQLSEALQVQPK